MEGRSGHIICKLVTQKPHALFRASHKSGCRDNEPEMQEDVVLPCRMNSVPAISHSIPLHWESHVGTLQEDRFYSVLSYLQMISSEKQEMISE